MSQSISMNLMRSSMPHSNNFISPSKSELSLKNDNFLDRVDQNKDKGLFSPRVSQISSTQTRVVPLQNKEIAETHTAPKNYYS